MSTQQLCENVRLAVQLKDRSIMDIYDVAAVCFKESAGNGFFSPMDVLYRVNLLAVSAGAHVLPNQFEYFIQVHDGPNKGRIPKFRFERSWYEQIQISSLYKHLTKLDQALWACSIGIAQKSILYLMASGRTSQSESVVQNFCSDEAVQIRQCYADLEALAVRAHGNKALAFSQYNAGASSMRVTDYGAQVLKFSGEFRSGKNSS
jgi:hypothetical protein